MDTTLRDGEQTPQLSFNPAEKLHIARVLLLEVGVDRIEVGSTGASPGEREAVTRIASWAREAGCLSRVEVLGFCDGQRSAQWLRDVGDLGMNLLIKGSEAHCRKQLKLTPEQHFDALEHTITQARALGVRIAGVYLEDWSQGIVNSPEYVMQATRRLQALQVPRIYLADTLGCLSPSATSRLVGTMTAAFPTLHFEFHCHNDYGLATANVLAAVAAGARGVHTSVNGLGERAGNARLCEVVVALADHMPEVSTGVNESTLADVSSLVETFSGKQLADNSPIVGRDVFTQTAGVHADGDKKAGLYETKLSPERFGRRRHYALGKLSGRASLDQNLSQMGIVLSPQERDRLLARVIELGDQKRPVHPCDLPFLINDLLGQAEAPRIRIRDYHVSVKRGQRPSAAVELELDGRVTRGQATGAGGYDALMDALRQAVEAQGLALPPLTDFRVRIPADGGGTGALVETAITWGEGERSFATVGVDTDQIGAAVIATEKMLQAHVERLSGSA